MGDVGFWDWVIGCSGMQEEDDMGRYKILKAKKGGESRAVGSSGRAVHWLGHLL